MAQQIRQNNQQHGYDDPADSDSTQQSADWNLHEHTTPSVQNEAQKLVNQAGSAELAKQAIDSISPHQDEVESPLDEFAQGWGFGSITQMMALSTRLIAPSGTSWWATPVQDQGWIVWNESDFSVRQRFPSLEACHRYIAQDLPLPPHQNL